MLFDKSQVTNWASGWHRDRTICVRERIDVAGFGPWATKSGLQHVEPPFELFTDMVMFRVHLDPVDVDNATVSVAFR